MGKKPGKRIYVYINQEEWPLDGAWISIADEHNKPISEGYADSETEIFQLLNSLGIEEERLVSLSAEARPVRICNCKGIAEIANLQFGMQYE